MFNTNQNMLFTKIIQENKLNKQTCNLPIIYSNKDSKLNCSVKAKHNRPSVKE